MTIFLENLNSSLHCTARDTIFYYLKMTRYIFLTSLQNFSWRSDNRPCLGEDRKVERPLSFQQRESLKAQLQVWLRDGVIRAGNSPWGSALVPVLKKDNMLRWTVDYRLVNRVTVPDSFPTPRIDALLEGLGGSAPWMQHKPTIIF